jgi:hypothetical protein
MLDFNRVSQGVAVVAMAAEKKFAMQTMPHQLLIPLTLVKQESIYSL